MVCTNKVMIYPYGNAHQKQKPDGRCSHSWSALPIIAIIIIWSILSQQSSLMKHLGDLQLGLWVPTRITRVCWQLVGGECTKHFHDHDHHNHDHDYWGVFFMIYFTSTQICSESSSLILILRCLYLSPPTPSSWSQVCTMAHMNWDFQTYLPVIACMEVFTKSIIPPPLALLEPVCMYLHASSNPTRVPTTQWPPPKDASPPSPKSPTPLSRPAPGFVAA